MEWAGLGMLLFLAVAAIAAVMFVNQEFRAKIFDRERDFQEHGNSSQFTSNQLRQWFVWNDRHKTDSVDDYNGQPYLLVYDELADEFIPSANNVGDLKANITAASGGRLEGDLHFDNGDRVKGAVGIRDGDDIVWRDGSGEVVQTWSMAPKFHA